MTKEKLFEVISSPESIIKLCNDLLNEQHKNEDLQAENAILADKAFYYDSFVDKKQCTNLRTTAKELGIPERKFVQFLVDKKFIFKTKAGSYLPYSKDKNSDCFKVKDYMSHGHFGCYTLITPQGKKMLAELKELKELILQTAAV